MSYSSTDKPTVPQLCAELSSVVDWQEFAIFLPGIEAEHIDTIRNGHQDTASQTRAVFQKWLDVQLGATWSNVYDALVSIDKVSLASSLVKEINQSVSDTGSSSEFLPQTAPSLPPPTAKEGTQTMKHTFMIIQEEDKVEQTIAELYEMFMEIIYHVRMEFTTYVTQQPAQLQNIIRFTESAISCSQLVRLNASNVDEYFHQLHPYYDFLECGIITSIVKKFIGGKLEEKLREYSAKAREFCRTAPIRQLAKGIATNFNGLSTIDIKLETPWEHVVIEGLYVLIKHLLPKPVWSQYSLMNNITISPGCLLLQYGIEDEGQIDTIIQHVLCNIHFLRLIGVFRLSIDERHIIFEEENPNFSFNNALLDATKASNNQAIQLLLDIGVNINDDGLTALMLADADTGGGNPLADFDTGDGGGNPLADFDTGDSGGDPLADFDTGDGGGSPLADFDTGDGGGNPLADFDTGDSGGDPLADFDTGDGGGSPLADFDTGDGGGNPLADFDTGDSGGDPLADFDTGDGGGDPLADFDTGDGGGNPLADFDTGDSGGDSLADFDTGDGGGNPLADFDTGDGGGNPLADFDTGDGGGDSLADFDTGDGGGNPLADFDTGDGGGNPLADFDTGDGGGNPLADFDTGDGGGNPLADFDTGDGGGDPLADFDTGDSGGNPLADFGTGDSGGDPLADFDTGDGGGDPLADFDTGDGGGNPLADFDTGDGGGNPLADFDTGDGGGDPLADFDTGDGGGNPLADFDTGDGGGDSLADFDTGDGGGNPLADFDTGDGGGNPLANFDTGDGGGDPLADFDTGDNGGDPLADADTTVGNISLLNPVCGLPTVSPHERVIAMSYSPTDKPTMEQLCRRLSSVTYWQIFAIMLPGIESEHIEEIENDNNESNDQQKKAVFKKWLEVYPGATWSNVYDALVNMDMISLACSLVKVKGQSASDTKSSFMPIPLPTIPNGANPLADTGGGGGDPDNGGNPLADFDTSDSGGDPLADFGTGGDPLADFDTGEYGGDPLADFDTGDGGGDPLADFDTGDSTSTGGDPPADFDTGGNPLADFDTSDGGGNPLADFDTGDGGGDPLADFDTTAGNISLVHPVCGLPADPNASPRERVIAMSYSPTDKPTVPQLCKGLSSIIDWQYFAILLPGIKMETIKTIERECHGTGINRQKMALFEKWIDINPGATWSDVYDALVTIDNISLASSLVKVKNQSVSSQRPHPLVEHMQTETIPIQGDIGKTLLKLYQKYMWIIYQVKTEFITFVTQQPDQLKNIIRFTENAVSPLQLVRLKAKSIEEYFEQLDQYYDFLDCRIIANIVKVFLKGSLTRSLQEYTAKASEFRKTVPIKELANKLHQVHVATISSTNFIIYAKLQDSWENVAINGLYVLIKHLVPMTAQSPSSLLNKITVSSGCLLLQYGIRDEGQIYIILQHILCNVHFLRLIGIFALSIDGRYIFFREENPNFSFNNALLDATKASNNEAIKLLLDVGANINYQDDDGLTALMLATRLNDTDTIHQLLQAGADISIKKKDGTDALMAASSDDIVRLLLSHGADSLADFDTGDSGGDPLADFDTGDGGGDPLADFDTGDSGGDPLADFDTGDGGGDPLADFDTGGARGDPLADFDTGDGGGNPLADFDTGDSGGDPLADFDTGGGDPLADFDTGDGGGNPLADFDTGDSGGDPLADFDTGGGDPLADFDTGDSGGNLLCAAMFYSPITKSALPLSSITEWESFATFLPGIEVEHIDTIRNDHQGTKNQTRAVFQKWLDVQPGATWSNVYDALTKVEMKLLASSLVKARNQSASDTDKFLPQTAPSQQPQPPPTAKEGTQTMEHALMLIQDNIGNTLLELYEMFKFVEIIYHVKIEFTTFVTQQPAQLKNIIRFTEDVVNPSQLTKLDASNIKEYFHHLCPYYDFLEFGVITSIVKQFIGGKLEESLQAYSDKARQFCKTAE